MIAADVRVAKRWRLVELGLGQEMHTVLTVVMAQTQPGMS